MKKIIVLVLALSLAALALSACGQKKVDTATEAASEAASCHEGKACT